MNSLTQFTSTLERAVTDADTAARFGENFPSAASTPFVLGLAEVACHQAVRSLLSEGEITVGTGASIVHSAPTPVGGRLAALAALIARDGRRLTFDVEVHDETGGTVATISHTRAIVRREQIEERLAR